MKRIHKPMCQGCFLLFKKAEVDSKKKVKRMPTLPTNGRSSFEHLPFAHVKRRKKLQFRLMKTRKKNTTLYNGPQPHFSMTNFLTTRSKTMLLFFKAAKTEKYVNRQ